MAIKYIIRAACTCLAIVSFNAAAIPVLVTDGDQIAGVDGLFIGGTKFDVLFHDLSLAEFTALASTRSVYPPLFAPVASMALVDFLLSVDNVAYGPQSISGCYRPLVCNILTLTNVDEHWAEIDYVVVHYLTDETPLPPTPYVFHSGYARLPRSFLDDTAADSTTYASYTFTVSAPEPPIVLMLASGLVVVGLARRKVCA